MSARSTTLDIDGAAIHVTERGAGPALLLVHGGLGSGAEWAPLTELLADRFRVLTPDSRGHGRSTNPAGALSYPRLADDLAALIDALRLDRPTVVGWSDGGQAVLELALRHPQVAGALVVGGAYPDFATSGLRDTHRGLLGADQAGVPDLAHLDAELGPTADELKALHPGGAPRWAELIRQTASMWLDYPGLPMSAMATINTPTLVLAADRDEMIPLELTLALYRALPAAELAVAPGSDHGAPMTPGRVAVFAAVIRDFAERRLPPAASPTGP
jgi:pimeloyl-ACP methyl ester carboxylesterase